MSTFFVVEPKVKKKIYRSIKVRGSSKNNVITHTIIVVFGLDCLVDGLESFGFRMLSRWHREFRFFSNNIMHIEKGRQRDTQRKGYVCFDYSLCKVGRLRNIRYRVYDLKRLWWFSFLLVFNFCYARLDNISLYHMTQIRLILRTSLLKTH